MFIFITFIPTTLQLLCLTLWFYSHFPSYYFGLLKAVMALISVLFSLCVCLCLQFIVMYQCSRPKNVSHTHMLTFHAMWSTLVATLASWLQFEAQNDTKLSLFNGSSLVVVPSLCPPSLPVVMSDGNILSSLGLFPILSRRCVLGGSYFPSHNFPYNRVGWMELLSGVPKSVGAVKRGQWVYCILLFLLIDGGFVKIVYSSLGFESFWLGFGF